MALIRAARSVLRKNFITPAILGIRNAGHWNKDYQPGPYPRTPEERAAAAKRYGLLPEDYEPYPEEDNFGDYPNLPVVSAEARDPFDTWDYGNHRRNFGEPLHVNSDIYGEDRVNANFVPKIPYRTQFAYLFGVLFVSAVLFAVTEHYPIHHAVMPKHQYQPGVKHYTFEPES